MEENWWRVAYSYAEYLCSECYDLVVISAREFNMYKGDPEFTKILRSL